MLSWIRKFLEIDKHDTKETPKYTFPDYELAKLKKILERVNDQLGKYNTIPRVSNRNYYFDTDSNILTYSYSVDRSTRREIDLDYMLLSDWVIAGKRGVTPYEQEQAQGWMIYFNQEFNHPTDYVKSLSNEQREFLIRALTLFNTYTAKGFLIEHKIGGVTKFITKSQIEAIIEAGYYNEDDVEAINILRGLYITKLKENRAHKMK